MRNIPSLRIWKIIAVISILLNFFQAYFSFQPIVTIDYASHIIPENPLSLPIKIDNQSLFSLHNVFIQVEDNLTLESRFKMKGNKYIEKLVDLLPPKKSIDFIHNESTFTVPNKPISGNLVVTVKYQLPILYSNISEQRKFKIYKSKDGFIRWIAIQ